MRHLNLAVYGGLLACIGLGTQSALASLSIGFESTEGYTGSATGTAVVGQNGWFSDGSLSWQVHTYTDAQVPWEAEHNPTSPQVWTPSAVNPDGGSQFLALGCADIAHTHTAINPGGRSFVATGSPIAQGLVEVTVDICIKGLPANALGNELAYNPWNWSLSPRTNAGGGGGIGQISQTVGSGGITTWGVNYYAGGGYTGNLLGITGFDNLSFDHWYKMGYLLDTVNGAYNEFMMKDLVTGDVWTYTPTSPISTGLGGGDINAVRMYSVGWTGAAGVDNLYVGDYQSLVWVPEPSTWALFGLGSIGLLTTRRRK
ncbi:MAG: PEP-CTERM sorting domain-containing protein [Verrucomicrobia bacterium]|nr:PEP-CTERM sorting domain-containing protein [Verrucomicrobiota bacterium]